MFEQARRCRRVRPNWMSSARCAAEKPTMPTFVVWLEADHREEE